MTGIARNSRALGVLLLCCLHSWRLAAGQDISEANKADLLGFFDSIDTDHDGQIEVCRVWVPWYTHHIIMIITKIITNPSPRVGSGTAAIPA